MTLVVDIGVGNLGAFLTMLRRLGVAARASDEPASIATAERLILPGVGHFDHAARELRRRGLESVLRYKALEERVPVLGVCVGMQLMLARSEEGTEPGLSWVPGEVRRFDAARLAADPARRQLPVPHMGWNAVLPVRDSVLFDTREAYRFYFVHSYHACCADPADVIATTVYGYPFASAFRRGNLFGCQFHPEKSHKFGKGLLRRFVDFKPTGALAGRHAPSLAVRPRVELPA